MEGNVEITEDHIDFFVPGAKPPSTVHDATPGARWVHLAENGERGQLDGAAIVDCEVPVAPGVRVPHAS
jgi:hypothetical protein